MNYDVKVIDHEKETITAILGISPERDFELIKIMSTEVLECVIKGKDMHLALVEMSKHCKHANELAFICMSFGKTIAGLSANPELIVGVMYSVNKTYAEYKEDEKEFK